MNKIAQFWPMLKQTTFFKLFSSVKLAIPLLIIVAIAVAWGTIIESKYNADMARIIVYNSNWFSFLTTLLWLNILFAALSRLPWRAHHLGFVTTHLGLLVLLGGGVITTQFGIDGTLSIPEEQSENLVALSNLVVGLAPEGSQNYQTIEIPRTLKEGTNFSYINEQFGRIFTLQRHVPFAELRTNFVTTADSDDIAIGIILKSQFFNVSEFLHSRINQRMQLGPATLELANASTEPVPAAGKKNMPKKSVSSKPKEILQILDAQSGNVIQVVSINDFKQKNEIKINNVLIKFKGSYKSAAVTKEGLSENEGGKPNPALELIVEQDGISGREVVFAKFPGFSINKSPAKNLKFNYLAGPVEDLGSDNAETTDESSSTSSGNHIRFRVISREKPEQIEIQLSKNGKTVLKKVVQTGETLETPWMGMRLTVASVIAGAVQRDEVIAVEPTPRSNNLPPAAINIQPTSPGAPAIWIPEGETRIIKSGDRSYSVYFGRKLFRLPFSLHLQKFHKVDYPGTDTAMSFESDVSRLGQSGQNSEQSETTKISMNEPMERDGYTIYQASYQMGPGQPTVSIFSVNKDPGRYLKYWGSLILCLGIIIFTVQRSQFYRQWKRARQ